MEPASDDGSEALSPFATTGKEGELWKEYVEYVESGSAHIPFLNSLKPISVMCLQAAAPELSMELIEAVPETYLKDMYGKSVRRTANADENEAFCQLVIRCIEAGLGSREFEMVEDFLNSKALSGEGNYQPHTEEVDGLQLKLSELRFSIAQNYWANQMVLSIITPWRESYGRMRETELNGITTKAEMVSTTILLKGMFVPKSTNECIQKERYAAAVMFMDEASKALERSFEEEAARNE